MRTTETLDKLYLEWSQFTEARTKREIDAAETMGKYFELLMAVERKFPNEDRHQTALRYIREAEARFMVNKSVKEAL